MKSCSCQKQGYYVWQHFTCKNVCTDKAENCCSCYLNRHSGQYKFNHTTVILAGWLKYLLSIPAQGVWLIKLCTRSPSHLTVTSWLRQFTNIPSSILCREKETRKATTPTRAPKNTAESGVSMSGARSGLPIHCSESSISRNHADLEHTSGISLCTDFLMRKKLRVYPTFRF